MAKGVFRNVILVGPVALKFPRINNFTAGLRCNRWEREMWRVWWRVWRPVFGWENLCPVKFSDPFGLIVIMPRAEQPVTFEEVIDDTPDYYPDITSETKPEDFGRVENKVLTLDYGLAFAGMVAERRAYYLNMVQRQKVS